jgi:hypothetical protein
MSKLSLFFSKLIPQKLERNIRDFRDLHLRQYAFEKLPAEIYNSQPKH